MENKNLDQPVYPLLEFGRLLLIYFTEVRDVFVKFQSETVL